MISALRKIEGRGDMPGANSAVMEMCIDNPREGFSNIFDTHPSVDKRVEALVKFAGGHDPGPLALDTPKQAAQIEPPSDATTPGGPSRGPVSGNAPVDGTPSPWGDASPADAPAPGPWGPRQS
jgi:heat shock protein HtpX